VTLAEAGHVGIKSQIEACNIELREVENRVSSRRAELEQLELRLETAIQMQKLSNKVQRVASHKCIQGFQLKLYVCVTYCNEPDIHWLFSLFVLKMSVL